MTTEPTIKRDQQNHDEKKAKYVLRSVAAYEQTTAGAIAPASVGQIRKSSFLRNVGEARHGRDVWPVQMLLEQTITSIARPTMRAIPPVTGANTRRGSVAGVEQCPA